MALDIYQYFNPTQSQILPVQCLRPQQCARKPQPKQTNKQTNKIREECADYLFHKEKCDEQRNTDLFLSVLLEWFLCAVGDAHNFCVTHVPLRNWRFLQERWNNFNKVESTEMTSAHFSDIMHQWRHTSVTSYTSDVIHQWRHISVTSYISDVIHLQNTASSL